MKDFVEFAGIRFYCGEEDFTPKEQTEFLVKVILEHTSRNEKLNIIDVCTGIGNIAIVLAIHHPEALIYGTDISQNSIKTANKNAKLHTVNNKVKFLVGDLMEPVKKPFLLGQTNVVVCNPPYIPSYLIKGNLLKEPKLAIDGGLTGFKFYKRVIGDASQFLVHGGLFAMETGSRSMGEALVKMIQFADTSIVPIPGRNEVVVLAQK